MNRKTLITLGIVGGVLLVIAMIFGGYYNSFVKKSQAVDGQWAQVETQYQRRIDLIPNLVTTAKAFMTQEQTVFENVANARSVYAGAKTTDEKVAAANQVEGSLSRLLAVVENYPQLKSNETMLSLMAELSGTENRVSVERKRFNDEVKVYNTSVKTFPGNMFAGLFGFSEKKFFEASDGAENAPTVNFN
jgi:LemA protein